mmetsp:Transcript_24195/g.67089  ORF Transcript_24195/g.67089 Transcript_24195/m.67089 type:complete len:1004 (-) Transcript_24195:2408-5419(-)
MSTEQHVADAALAVVRRNTDAHVRASASQYLEEWTKTDGAWEIYSSWLQHQLDSFDKHNGNNNNDEEQIGMQLLCLQLLQAKIRREIPRGTNVNPILERIHHSLARLLVVASNHGSARHIALQPASICYAALSVRCNALNQIVAQMTNIHPSEGDVPPVAALRVLSNLPLEVDACADLTTANVTELLWPFVEKIMEVCGHFMQQEVAASATEVLQQWTQCCHVSLSQLNIPIGENKVVVLPILVHILSQQQYSDEELPVKASKCLVEALVNPTDACTDARRVSCEALLHAISTGGFISAPLHFATSQGWEDTCHALTSVLCTLVTEEVDYCVTTPSDALLNLLLQVQNHPQIKVGCLVLECWLTVQDIPTAQRHGNWKAPLFKRVVECLMNQMAYPSHFVNWEEELEVDESEFEEFRQMVRDVLISSYFLLRTDYVKSLAQALILTQQHSTSWVVEEAALYALTVSSREVCARIKARGGGTLASRDREETTQIILSLAQHLCGTDQTAAIQSMLSRHWLVLSGACDLIGAYSAAWSTKCTPESIYQLLKCLCIALSAHPMVEQAASWALRSMMIGCAPKLVADSNAHQAVPQYAKEAMEDVLSKQDEQSMVNVAEGCTRLVVQIPDGATSQRAISVLVASVVHRCDAALLLVPVTPESGFSEQASDAVEALDRYLRVLQVIVRFCERNDSHPASDFLNVLWPLLETASQRLVPYDSQLKKVLSIHEQLLKNMPSLVAPHFESTAKYVVRIFETRKDPNAMAYMATAVESYGDKNVFDFEKLLSHLFGVLSPLLSSNPLSESCDLIAAFYKLCIRYLIFCPGVTARSSVLPDIVTLAVVCLSECKGERESTRECFGFLTKVYGWRTLPISEEGKVALQAHAQRLDEVLVQNGAKLIRSSMEILVGGSPILWAAGSDCVFSVVSASSGWPASNGHHSTNIARQWLESVHTKQEHAAAYNQVVHLLLALCNGGSKNKAKAKLLLSDYSSICKGEASVDALLSYSLP